jgi:hypothetical protein
LLRIDLLSHYPIPFSIFPASFSPLFLRCFAFITSLITFSGKARPVQPAREDLCRVTSHDRLSAKLSESLNRNRLPFPSAHQHPSSPLSQHSPILNVYPRCPSKVSRRLIRRTRLTLTSRPSFDRTSSRSSRIERRGTTTTLASCSMRMRMLLGTRYRFVVLLLDLQQGRCC